MLSLSALQLSVMSVECRELSGDLRALQCNNKTEDDYEG